MKRISPLLTSEEKEAFERCDKIVQDTTPAVEKWGEALLEIKTGSLWRADFFSFEDYCLARIGWTLRHANRILKAAKFRDEQKQLADAGEPATVPETERQARQMLAEQKDPITPDQLPSVADGPPADVIRTNTDGVRTNTDTEKGPMGPDLSEEQDNQDLSGLAKQFKDAKGRDKMGYPVPGEIWETFLLWREMKALVDKLSNIKFHVEEAVKAKKLAYQWLPPQKWLDKISEVIFDLKNAQPYAVCPYCQGRSSDQCVNCHATGVVTQFFIERQADVDLVKMRKAVIADLQK